MNQTIYYRESLKDLTYNVRLEKGLDDIGPAVCDSINTIYQSLCSISSEPFSKHTLYLKKLL